MRAKQECNKVSLEHGCEKKDSEHVYYLGELGGSGVHKQYDVGWQVTEDVGQEDDTDK